MASSGVILRLSTRLNRTLHHAMVETSLTFDFKQGQFKTEQLTLTFGSGPEPNTMSLLALG